VRRIETPGVVKVTYDAAGRIASLTRVTDVATDSGPTSSFSYLAPDAPCDAAAGDIGRTLVTTSVRTTTYCNERDLSISYEDTPGDAGGGSREVYEDDDLTSEDLGDGIDYTCDPHYVCDPGDPDADATDGLSVQGIPDGSPRWGLSDSNDVRGFNMFADRFFHRLDIQYVRLTVPFDAARDPDGRDVVDAWINAARDPNQPGGRKRVLISFERWRTPRASGESCTTYLPPLDEYRGAVGDFLARWGDRLAEQGHVPEFTAWNEPNNTNYQPTATVAPDGATPGFANSGAFAAGAYWRALWELCQARTPRCTVAAGDFLDSKMADPADSTGGYARRYFTQYVAGLGRQRPPVWAWHAYSDGDFTKKVSDGQAAPFTRLRRFLRATASLSGTSTPTVWLTEQGAIRKVRRPNGTVRHKHTISCQARIMRLLLTAPAISDRIRRFYAYQLRGDRNWDTGLLNITDSRPRMAYKVYRAKSRPSTQTSVRGRC
jgi:hypothetical protein